MKRNIILISLVLLALFSLSSCKRVCHCVRYNGVIDEFTQEELDEKGYECLELDTYQYNFGKTYSRCEWVM